MAAPNGYAHTNGHHHSGAGAAGAGVGVGVGVGSGAAADEVEEEHPMGDGGDNHGGSEAEEVESEHERPGEEEPDEDQDEDEDEDENEDEDEDEDEEGEDDGDDDEDETEETTAPAAAAAATDDDKEEIPEGDEVHMVIHFKDWPRSGVANYHDTPHYFENPYDEGLNGYGDTYYLTPLDPITFLQVVERRNIDARWRSAYKKGSVELDLCCLPQDVARRQELITILDAKLVTDPARTIKTRSVPIFHPNTALADYVKWGGE